MTETERYITLGAFRRAFFQQGNRPPKKTVMKWIEEGTAEGVFLKATKIDGSYFIKCHDAMEFLDTLATKKIKRHDGAAFEKLRELGVNV